MATSPNAFASLVGVDHPIVLGPFGGLSSVELTATVSNGGGLGSFGLYGYSPERIRDTAEALRAQTDSPFALNLWLPIPGEEEPVVSDDEFERYLAPLRPYFDELGVAHPVRPARYVPDVEEQVAAVLEVAPAVISVVFGIPSSDFLDAAHTRAGSR